MILADVHAQAIQECENASALIMTTNIFYDNHVTYEETLYSASIHHCVINGAFLKLFMAFERFLECSFICYMLGQVGLNGTAVLKYVAPTTDTHALDLLKGTNHHADFTNRDTIIKLSKNFFENDGPYTALNGISVAFEEMKKIRNAISHVSLESEQAFLSLARSKLGSLPPEINTAIFLNTVIAGTSSTYFVYYKGIIESAINSIANPTP